MQVLLRLMLLVCFASVGVALAITVAVDDPARLLSSTASADESEEVLPEQDAVGDPPPDLPPQLDAPPVAVRPEAAPPAVAPPPQPSETERLIQTTILPMLAAYQPLVANQASALETLRQVQEGQKQSRQEMSKALDFVKQIVPEGALKLPKGVGDEPVSVGLQEGNPFADDPIESQPAEIDIDEEDRVTLDAPSSDIRELLKDLSVMGELNILASPSVQGTVTASLTEVSIDRALEAILKSNGYVYRRDGDFIYVGTAAELQTMEHVAEQVGTRIYRPNYVTADEFQKLVTPLLSEAVGSVTVSSSAEMGIESDSTRAGGDTYAGSEVIMVRDYLSILNQVDQVFSEVDRMPPQVSIEATILTVNLDDENQLGVDFELLRQQGTIRVTSGLPLQDLATAPFNGGLRVGFLDSSLFGFITALETIGDTNVVAAPRVMCLNKQRAEILIGQELGYVSTTVTAEAAVQTVEFMETGTHLRIRPFITSDGMIRMEVHPELSDGNVRVEQGFTLPTKNVTQVTTNVMCRTGQTVVLGGLIRESMNTTSTQIPVLGNLPFIGPAFRQRTEGLIRDEIIVLLTPRIIDEVQAGQEGKQYAQDGIARRDTYADKMTPVGQRTIAERYYRLATAAWNAEDIDVALRYTNLAIQFNPLHQGAISLREQLISIDPDLERGVHRQLQRGLPPWQHPLRDYSAHGYPARMHGNLDEPLPVHVEYEDAGETGRVRSLNERPSPHDPEEVTGVVTDEE